MPWTDFDGKRSVRERAEHVLVSLIVTDDQDKIAVGFINDLFCCNAFVNSSDSDFNYFVPIDHLQLTVPD